MTCTMASSLKALDPLSKCNFLLIPSMSDYKHDESCIMIFKEFVIRLNDEIFNNCTLA
jgi:hypothetical protein